MRLPSKTLIASIAVAALFFTFTESSAQSGGESINYYDNTPSRATIPREKGVIQTGEKLFNSHCSKCHAFEKQKIGPAIASATDRRPVSWLLAWIEDSQQVIQSGDDYANYLYKSYDGYVMPSFDYLSEEDKLAILAYIQNKSASPTHVSGTSSGDDGN